MPKNTFFNLNFEKREKILQCAKNEFAKCGFYNSSINKIIKEADISRGSFYQYFEDKEDLYSYMLSTFTFYLLDDIRAKVGNKKYDLFEFQLLIFDYLTLEVVNYKDKDFIISAVSNMDIKLGNNLLKLDNISDSLLSLISIDNLNVDNTDRYNALLSILIVSLTNELVSYFNNLKDLDVCRKSLITTADLIKYGATNNN